MKNNKSNAQAKMLKVTINGKNVGIVKFGDNLVGSVIVTYAKGKRNSANDLFLMAGYLTKGKIHKTILGPLDALLVKGDKVVVEVL